MVTIYPFKALRPVQEIAAQMASVPYDVITREEGITLAQGKPYSFLHVIRPDIDFPPETKPEDPQVYLKGKQVLQRWIQEKRLIQEKTPQLYLYQIQQGNHQQTGVVCCSSLAEYEKNIIKKHEKTRKDKEADRVEHFRIVSAHDEPCFLLFKTYAPLSKLLQQGLSVAPIYHFTAEDGISHRLYPVADPTPFISAFQKISELYVADGHHRTQAAYLLWKEAQTRVSDPKEVPPEYERFLTVLFPQEQLRILPYNRIIKEIPSTLQEHFFTRFQQKFPSVQSPLRKGVFRVYWNSRWSAHQIPESLYGKTPVEQLDVAVLQRELFASLLDLQDPRTDPRFLFVGGGSEEKLQKWTEENHYPLAVSLFPVAIEELIRISDAGEILPPKSTWFEPKLRSGLFLHLFE